VGTTTNTVPRLGAAGSTTHHKRKGKTMVYYVGLTDDPVKRRQEHGNPIDWNSHAPHKTVMLLACEL
jgi:hypothetical protein